MLISMLSLFYFVGLEGRKISSTVRHVVSDGQNSNSKTEQLNE